MIDAAILSLLGALLIFAPKQIEVLFGFRDLPPAVGYLIGMWGCVLATMAVGYIVAAADPLKHRIWAQVGIARGASECLLGVVYLAQRMVTIQQAGFGICVAAIMAIAYFVLCPRKPRLVAPNALNPRQAAAP